MPESNEQPLITGDQVPQLPEEEKPQAAEQPLIRGADVPGVEDHQQPVGGDTSPPEVITGLPKELGGEEVRAAVEADRAAQAAKPRDIQAGATVIRSNPESNLFASRSPEAPEQ